MRTVVLIAVLLLGLAARAPWVLRAPTEVERAHAGAARHFVLQRERTPPPLVLDPPAASYLGSPILWSLRAPAPEFDDAGPDDQIGWLSLRDTALPTEGFVATWIVIAAMRLPFVLLHLVGLYLVFRLGERFYGVAAGALAALLLAIAAEPSLTGASATPAALALPATALLLVALDDLVLALGHDGRPPPWLLRKRTITFAAACGLAVATSFGLLPIAIVAVLWMLDRRRAIVGRDDPCQPPSLARRVTGIVVACVLVWALYLGDVAPYPEADLTLPAPLWWEGLVAAARDGWSTPAAMRLDALIDAGGPGLLATGGLAVLAWPFLRRDRTDTPALLLTVAAAAVVTSAAVAPGHAGVAVAAALPPLAVLAAAGVVRFGRHARIVGAAAAALLLVGVGAGWITTSPWAPRAQPREPGPAHMTADEEWLLDRWVASREVARVVTVLDREPALRISAASRIEEIAPAPKQLSALLKEIEGGADAALVIGDWVDRSALPPALAEREPDTRFLRVSVYGTR